MKIHKIMNAPKSIHRKIALWAIRLDAKERLKIGHGCKIASPELIRLHESSSMLILGERGFFESDSLFNIRGICSIGSDVYISLRCIIGCESKVTIGQNTAIGPNVLIIDTNKNYSDISLAPSLQGSISKPVSIGADSWIGASAIILPGTILGKHTIVAAGSVVSGVYPDNVLLAGCPAKIVRTLDGE